MKPTPILFALFATALSLCAQTPPVSSSSDNSATSGASAGPEYTPPNANERFQAYLRGTFSVSSFLEAGAHAGIEQARSSPSQWPEGAEGYAERFGSAAGGIVVRGTTEFGMAALFREDLRHQPRGSRSVFTAALADTFTARKGEDGRTAFSFARLFGPAAGGLVESSWKPEGFERRYVVREVGLHYGFAFGRNLARELFRH